MNTTKTLGELIHSILQIRPWRMVDPADQNMYECAANAVLAESKVASDVLNASLVTLSMEVTEKNRIILESRASIEVLAEECRQKDLIIMELRESIGLAPLPAQALEEQGKAEPVSQSMLESAIDRLSTRCGFPVVLDRIQVLNTIGNHVEKQDRMLDELRTRAESAEARVTALEGELAAENRRHEQTITERDDAEQALSQAYYLVIGCSPEWSNNFGHEQALEEIEDACFILRDEARTIRSAESRVVALEGELREKVNLLAFAGVREIGYKKQLADLAWIPVSTRMPTEADADRWGDVLWLFGTSARVQKWYDKSSHHSEAPDAIGWFKLPPLPPTSPPGEETERKRFEDTFPNLDKKQTPSGMYAIASTQYVWEGWQAARQSTPKTEV